MLIMIILLGAVFLFCIVSIIVSNKMEKMPLPNDLNKLRRYLLLHLIFGAILVHHRFSPYHDFERIWRYDRLRRKWEYVPRPTMLTTKGAQVLHAFCVALNAEVPDSDASIATHCTNIPKWLCSCGRENEGYVSTCVCGKSKRKGVPQ